MHLLFDIFQGMGIAAAVGISPFLPALVVGALAAGNVEIHFNGTDYGFLQSGVFLLLLAVAVIALALAERRLPEGRQRHLLAVLAVAGLILGALLFAGSLARGHYEAWPGWIAGAACAAIAIAAMRPLLARMRGRLDAQTAGALPLYTDAAAAALAALSVIAPPVGLIGVALLVWLLIAGRKRDEQKYAGLRILR